MSSSQLYSLEQIVSYWNKLQHTGWHAAMLLHRNSQIVLKGLQNSASKDCIPGGVVCAVFQCSLYYNPASISQVKMGARFVGVAIRAVFVQSGSLDLYLCSLHIYARGAVCCHSGLRPEWQSAYAFEASAWFWKFQGQTWVHEALPPYKILIW